MNSDLPGTVGKQFLKEKFLPWQSRYANIDGLRLHYFDEGPANSSHETGSSQQPGYSKEISPGEPKTVLLLHGNPTWSFFFRELIHALRPHFRVLAVDYLGCGLSDRTPGRHLSAIERVDHLVAFLDMLGVKRCSLVMHDWGGAIGVALAGRNPERIDKLVFFNTTLTETENLPGFIKLAATPWLGKFLTRHTASFVRLMTRLGVVRRLPRDVCAGYMYPYRTAPDREAIWDFVADIPFGDHHPRFSAMQEVAATIPRLRNHPVLIVWGLRDPCFHREMLSQVAGHFPHAKVVEIPQASHLVLEDAPELVCRTVYDFLRRASPEPVQKHEQHTSMESPLSPVAEPALYRQLMQLASEAATREAVIVPQLAGVSSALGVDGPGIATESMTFGALAELVRKYERGLTENGLAPGDRVLMLVPPGIEFLALSYAVIGRGAVPVFLDPGMGKENLLRCIHDAAPHAFIGSPRAHLLRALRPRLFSSMKFKVFAYSWGVGSAMSLSFLKRFSAAPLPSVRRGMNDPALVAFTSGATGTPKGVIFTNAMLEEQVRIFSDVFGLQPGSRDMPLLPIFSLFGLACGVTTIFSPLDPSKPLAFNPLHLYRALSELRINTSFGSPTLWQRLVEFCKRQRLALPSLERVFMAGAPVPRSVIRDLEGLSPRVKVFTPYGATEALPVTLGEGADIGTDCPSAAVGGEVGTPVGRVVPGVVVRIIAATDEALCDIEEAQELPPGVIGEIIVRGAHVSPSYLNRPDANRAAKISSAQGIWHRIGDVGYLDERGMIYFCGRKSHVVATPQGTFYSEPVERIFNTHRWVRRSALISIRGGAEAAVAIEPLPEHYPIHAADRDRFSAELRALAATDKITAPLDRFFFHPSFPVDARHNAKIFRDRLGAWASEMLQRERMVA